MKVGAQVMKAIQQQIVEAKTNESINTLREAKCICKEFDFTVGILKDSLDEGRKKKGG